MTHQFEFKPTKEGESAFGGKHHHYDVFHENKRVGTAQTITAKDGSLGGSSVHMTHPDYEKHAYSAHEQLKRKIDPKLGYKHFKERESIDVEKTELCKFNERGQWSL